MQDEPDHAECLRDAHLAVSGDRREVAQYRPAGPDHELADARPLVLAAGWILRPEPLVVVVVPVDDGLNAVTRPAAWQVEPAVSCAFSTRRTSVQPASARW